MASDRQQWWLRPDLQLAIPVYVVRLQVAEAVSKLWLVLGISERIDDGIYVKKDSRERQTNEVMITLNNATSITPFVSCFP